MEQINLRIVLEKIFYSKESLLKAAFSFIDQVYVHLDEDEDHWIVNMQAKHGESEHLPEKFENELLAQEVRRVVYKRTYSIRELLLARAMASSFVTDDDPVAKIHEDEDSVSNEELSQILQDWYNQNES